ncbi:MAG: glycerophosphodiester phosphodiesterase [Candidatus Obscuribacterales bacterium]|nr:glycerophosphodiester phosphodiesterase [Candidatus Obscuribacterales bacterium]
MRSVSIFAALFATVSASQPIYAEESAPKPREGQAKAVQPGDETSFRKPIIIAHRGASGYRPEHTLAAYELAINLGADFIEPDLVATKDGALVARHDNELSQTTDVANHPEFANRKTKKTVDGKSQEGWFSEDFTLAEIKTLRARERMPKLRQNNTMYDDRFSIPTFQEVIDLAKRKTAELHRQIGVYPEAKHPAYFQSIGLPMETPLVEGLHLNGFFEATAPIFIQCFEPSTLKRLKRLTRINLVQLIADEGQPYDAILDKTTLSFSDMTKPAGLAEIKTYASGIGPDKHLIFPQDKSGNSKTRTSLVDDAHKAGLVVHPWTFRNENEFLPKNLQRTSPDKTEAKSCYGDALAEYALYYELGVDGVFSENPDTAIEARSN